MTATFTRGDTVYSIDGQQAEYLMPYEDQHLVLPHYRDDGDDPFGFGSGDAYPAGPTVWEAVFVKPPVPVVHEEVADARAELDATLARVREAEQQLRIMREERAQLQRDQAAVRTRLAEHQGLQRLDDFLAGRITHFVKVSHYYPPVIETFDAVMVREERRSGRELRLLGLFGDAARGLRWKVTPYGDGSGSTTDEVIPCTSLEQAQEKQRELITSRWAALSKDGPHGALCGTVELARQLGIPVPPDLATTADKIRRDGAASTLKSRREEAARVQRQLEEAEAAARAAGIDVSAGGA